MGLDAAGRIKTREDQPRRKTRHLRTWDAWRWRWDFATLLWIV